MCVKELYEPLGSFEMMQGREITAVERDAEAVIFKKVNNISFRLYSIYLN